MQMIFNFLVLFQFLASYSANPTTSAQKQDIVAVSHPVESLSCSSVCHADCAFTSIETGFHSYKEDANDNSDNNNMENAATSSCHSLLNSSLCEIVAFKTLIADPFEYFTL